MSDGAGLDALRARLLAARDARQALIERCGDGRVAVLVVAANVPGADKRLPGVERLVDAAAEAVRSALPDAARAGGGEDALGPYAIFTSARPADAIKRAAVQIEEGLPSGRLLDIDVHAADGRQVDRASLGLPPRRCLVCDEPAADCIRTSRHSPAEVASAWQKCCDSCTPTAASRKSAP